MATTADSGTMPADLLRRDFGTLPDMVRAHAAAHGGKAALVDPGGSISYADLDARMDRVAAALRRDGFVPGDRIAICAASSIDYVALFFGALRAAVAVAPLAPSSTPEGLLLQMADSGARLVFLDDDVARHLGAAASRIAVPRIALDGAVAGRPLADWLAGGDDAAPRGLSADPDPNPDDVFNIIYSSGTTGTPKGIVHTHGMRWSHIRRATYAMDAVTLLSTPLYSNTTLVSLLPAIGNGGTAILLPKFDAGAFLRLAQEHRATHAMLVPVQYRRLMSHPDFDRFDLSSFRMKFSTSAPFAADLKAEVLRRWPGGLTEYYGMTEGGGTCALACHDHPAKLHTVGRPLPGHDVRLIDEDGREAPAGEAGEVVGRSPVMMAGYLNRPDKTAEAEWWSDDGNRYIRTGDVGRFDADGFLVLLDRRKDMIVSGGFNIYPSDLEAVVGANPDVLEVAVVGVPSERWGETPVAFVVPRAGRTINADALRTRANAGLGRTQRLNDVVVVDSLPRSAIGKILKRDLRNRFVGGRDGLPDAAF